MFLFFMCCFGVIIINEKIMDDFAVQTQSGLSSSGTAIHFTISVNFTDNKQIKYKSVNAAKTV